jgi:hypothetical protein
MQLKFEFDTKTYFGRDVTTDEVSEFLEKHYGILEAFVEAHNDDFAKLIENDVAEMFVKMAEKGVAPTLAKASKHSMLVIKSMFDTFIRSREVEGLVPNAPTERAKRGFKSGTKRRKGRSFGTSRPSFLDTELYVKSFKATIIDD